MNFMIIRIKNVKTLNTINIIDESQIKETSSLINKIYISFVRVL